MADIYKDQPTRRHKDNIAMKVIKNSTGFYFVHERGFTSRTVSGATQFDDRDVLETQRCLRSAGHGITATEDVKSLADVNIVQNTDGTSFAVCFVRPKQIRSDLSLISNKLNPSKRRFRTEAEAQHHATRFTKIEKHAGYFIIRRYEPVNAYINQVTGKTNPEVGKARTDRG